MSILDPTIEAIDEALQLGDFAVSDIGALEEIEPRISEPTHGEVPEPAGDHGQARITPQVPAMPAQPNIPVMVRPVSGRYRGTFGAFQLELRVDVDRAKPLKRLSGDFFQTIGRTTKYMGSFVVNAPTVTIASMLMTIRGVGTFSVHAGAPIVQVTIPRRSVIQPYALASVQFFTLSGSPGAAYPCSFESAYFRTVQLETDWTSDLPNPVFSSYNTGSLPSGGPARTLSVVGAYAEAGIQMVTTAGGDVVNITGAGSNAMWSNAELHASMQEHFSRWREAPQWAVWQLVARMHELGSGLCGIMFDQQGLQRQGCAVFHAGIGGTTPEKLRLQLYTYVHELGHCFNLMHSWQKQYANPPVPNRPSALSWMNYPWYFPASNGQAGGEASFWSNFPFQFDTDELIHLRHAFRNNIIIGGNPFTSGAALSHADMGGNVRDESGLRLLISTHQSSFSLGEPVVLELSLETLDMRGARVHTWLHPNCGLVRVAIRKPGGGVVEFEPLIDHLVGDRMTMIGAEDSIKDSAYIGFGRAGFYFDQPGQYRIRAVYAALDGSEVVSDIITIRVRYPVTAAEESLADLFLGEDQGALLSLLGSDSPYLQKGNDAFDEVLEKHGKHPMANYARLVKGINAARTFKTITAANADRLVVRNPRPEESAKMLTMVVDSSILDPVSNQMVMTNLASAQASSGNEDMAKRTLAALAALRGGKL